jgi:hypothetical protein
MLSPVDEALEWLDAMNGREPKESLDLAEKWAKAGEWGWVQNVIEEPKSKSAKLAKLADAAATKAAAEMSTAMKGKPQEWLPLWLEFWRVHGASPAAQQLVSKYLDKRDKQRRDGEKLFNQARGLLREEKKEEGYAVLEQLLEEAPCSYEAFYAQSWLAARK